MVRELQDNMKHNNISIIGIQEGEEEEQGIEHLFETNDEQLPQLDERKSHKNIANTESQ